MAEGPSSKPRTLPEPPAGSGSEPDRVPADYRARNDKVIWLLLVATFVVILNETIMSVALRVIMLDLHIDTRSVQWLSTAFMLTMAVVIPITGFLLQRFHTRPMFAAAMTLFCTGTLMAALSPGFELLIVARVVQACGTAIMLPLLMTTIMTLVPADERGKTMGNVSIVISVAPAIGPTISGLILNALSWRWLFWLVLPIAVVMLIIGVRRVENVSEPRRLHLDVPSVVLSALGFGGLIYGLSRVGEDGAPQSRAGTGAGTALPMWIALAVGAAGLAAFIIRQLRLQPHGRALLDLSTFRSRTFTMAIAMMALMMMALFGTIIVLPLYLQQVLGLQPVQTGLLLLPGGLVMGLLAPLVGRLYDRYGPTVLLVPGSIIVSTVLWVLSTVGQDTSPFFVLAAHLLLSLGMALLFTPLFTAGLGAVEPQLYSHGSAIVGTVQQVAGAAGTALFVTVLAVQTSAFSAGGAADRSAAAGGSRAAFLAGAVISVLAVAAAFFIRKPPDLPGAPSSGSP